MTQIKYTYRIGNQFVDTMDFNEIPPDTEYTTSEVIELPEPILVPESISRMALKIQLLLKGVEIEDIIETIDGLPPNVYPEIQRKIAIIKFNEATSFDRYNPELNLVAHLMNLSQEDLDEIFINGNAPI
jgi:hypothetical protein